MSVRNSPRAGLQPKHHDRSEFLRHPGSLARNTKPNDFLLHDIGNILPNEANDLLVLAAAVLPLAIVTLRRGLIRDVARHRRIARITLPIWLYVAGSGWLVWYMLYRMQF